MNILENCDFVIRLGVFRLHDDSHQSASRIHVAYFLHLRIRNESFMKPVVLQTTILSKRHKSEHPCLSSHTNTHNISPTVMHDQARFVHTIVSQYAHWYTLCAVIFVRDRSISLLLHCAFSLSPLCNRDYLWVLCEHL